MGCQARLRWARRTALLEERSLPSPAETFLHICPMGVGTHSIILRGSIASCSFLC